MRIPTTPVPTGKYDPHDVGRLRDGEKCSVCGKEAVHLRFGRPTCKKHRRRY